MKIRCANCGHFPLIRDHRAPHLSIVAMKCPCCGLSMDLASRRKVDAHITRCAILCSENRLRLFDIAAPVRSKVGDSA